MGIKENYWSGSSSASEVNHDAVFEMFDKRFPMLAAWRFQVNDALDDVRVAPSNDKYASNGIWTLAELLANGSDRDEIERVALLMVAAIDEK